MAEVGPVEATNKAWLLSQTGSPLSVRFPVPEGTTRIGRAPDNELVIQGPTASTVSLHHVAIDSNGGFHIRDLDSTNGTFINGERVTDAELQPNSSIRLGSQGPELLFILGEPPEPELSQTKIIPESPGLDFANTPSPANTIDHLLAEGVEQARQARAEGISGQTMTIMRQALDRALYRSSRRFRVAVAALAFSLIGVSGFAGWKILKLNREESAINTHIQELEAQLQTTSNAAQADRLITQLDSFENQGEQLQHELLYRLRANREREDFVTQEIRRLLAEFGAEEYSVSPEFTERVKYHIQQYEGPDRPLMQRALGIEAGQFDTMRRILTERHLPGDLTYLPLVESALGQGESGAGAAGPWQLTLVTAKALGLEVGNGIDQRLNTVDATEAASKYLRQLILDFGSGSSVMIALAAYNGGPTKVKQAIEKTVSDPIKQRNFWYLYRVHALPDETREYVPKVIGAMIIGRDPARFGFHSGQVPPKVAGRD
jgi:pSer/pThr/pTyr-binding forkhead associated (FHA) protein